jgi:hypothetical protein
MGSAAGERGKEQRSATPHSLTCWAGGDKKQSAQRPCLTSALRVVCGNEKAGAGVLSGMDFLLTRTTRKR